MVECPSADIAHKIIEKVVLKSDDMQSSAFNFFVEFGSGVILKSCAV